MLLSDKSVIVGSVGCGPFVNRGNALIERETLAALGLPHDTPRFSVFEPMSEERANHINRFDLVVFTGCTILQASAGHRNFFNRHCEAIHIPKLLFGGAFCCDLDDEPDLKLARWFDGPLGARDPWTAAALERNGIEAVLVGCPTLLAPLAPDCERSEPVYVLFSSTPELDLQEGLYRSVGPARWVRHEPGENGVDIMAPELFDGVRLAVTGRLHLALPAIARGIPVAFFGPDHWRHQPMRQAAGRTRLTLLEWLGVPLSGEISSVPSAPKVDVLKANFDEWIGAFL